MFGQALICDDCGRPAVASEPARGIRGDTYWTHKGRRLCPDCFERATGRRMGTIGQELCKLNERRKRQAGRADG